MIHDFMKTFTGSPVKFDFTNKFPNLLTSFLFIELNCRTLINFGISTMSLQFINFTIVPQCTYYMQEILYKIIRIFKI